MPSKKKCSSYASELASKHTTRAAVGLNACRWERRTEDTPAYDVVPPDAAGIVSYRKKHPDKTYGHVGGNAGDAISLWDPPKAKKLSAAGQKRVAKSKEMEFVQAPRKVQPKAKPKPKSKPLPANLREGLTAQQRKQLQSYTGQRGKRLKQRIEIYLKRGLSFSEAEKRAISRDKNETVPVTKKKRVKGRGGKRFIFDEALG